MKITTRSMITHDMPEPPYGSIMIYRGSDAGRDSLYATTRIDTGWICMNTERVWTWTEIFGLLHGRPDTGDSLVVAVIEP